MWQHTYLAQDDAGSGRGKLCVCSSVLCWLASIMEERKRTIKIYLCPTQGRCTGQDLKIKEKIDFKKIWKNKKETLQSILPLHACSWLVSTFLISFTQVALTSGVGAYPKINTISHQAQNSYYINSCRPKCSLRGIIQEGQTKLPLQFFREQKQVVATGTGWGRGCACATAKPHLLSHRLPQWQLQ